jgi:hypothetical protein
MSNLKLAVGACALAGVITACVRSPETATEPRMTPAARMTPTDGSVRLYAAELLPVNHSLRGGVTGRASFVIQNDRLDVTLDVDNLTPGSHIAHVQGFADGREAICPLLQADTNGDDVIDASEATIMSGTPLIPLNGSIESLDLYSDDYPHAAHNGRLRFDESTSLAELQSALQDEMRDRALAFDRHVVMLYGLPDSAELPPSVQTLSNQTAHASVPVACGVITRIR